MNSNINSFIRRNLFEIENARNLSRDELVETFVATKAFWRLLSSKNHIILGARGSGKTALAKMLSHDHLSKFQNERAQGIIKSKEFIGIFVPSSVEWVGGLNNKPWQNDSEAENYFQWRFNVATCNSFLITLRSLLETYVDDVGERAFKERAIAQRLAEAWADDGARFVTIRELQNYLEDTEFKRQQQIAKERALGIKTKEAFGVIFTSDLFVPLRRGISLASRYLDIPDSATWILCLDEAEFLSEAHHRILNTYLRSDLGNLVFKITTMPYQHHTLQTNSGASLNVGHDFEYVYIDIDPIYLASYGSLDGNSFANTLFNKRMRIYKKLHRTITLRHLLGTSELLERKDADNTASKYDEIMKQIEEHCSSGTIIRARKLLENSSKFSDQISRKIHSAILLREAVSGSKGRSELDIYSGDKMVIRCGDGNPRRLIRLFNSLILELPSFEHIKISPDHPILPKNKQTAILTAFSTTTLSRVQSEPKYGRQLHRFLQSIGTFMSHQLHNQPLSTDQVSSIEIDSNITDLQWELVKRAVGLGLLFPNVSHNNPDQMPEREGTFHLAYVLAPHFKILPRRGASQSLYSIMRNLKNIKTNNRKKSAELHDQLEFQLSEEV